MADRPLQLAVRLAGLVVAAGFSVGLVALYPVLTGEFVIHKYPPWPPPVAMGYILGGILLQAWFCFDTNRRLTSLAWQALTGAAYSALIIILPGGLYLT